MTSQAERLPTSTHLGRARLQVADLARAIAWYERVLGMQLLEHSGGRAALGPVGSRSALLELHERPGVVPVRRRSRLGLFHFAILLPDRASLGRFLRHVAGIDEPIGASDHLVSEALYLHDPDGLGIEVYADRPPTTWERVDGELVMDTRPLDIDDIIGAAGPAPWTGMPPGTVMGHMHLHVGDLPGAARFYRDALGFDTTVWSYPGALFLSAGGYHHHLGVNTWAGEDARRPAENDARLLEWELVLPSTDAVNDAAGRMETAGYAAVRSGLEVRVDDPWGTTLVLRN